MTRWEKWGALPLGELHPADRCALCGGRGDLKRTVLVGTYTVALRCRDDVVCVRRRMEAKAA